jgi:hypothetical protein
LSTDCAAYCQPDCRCNKKSEHSITHQ